jgi:hypothetical protein
MTTGSFLANLGVQPYTLYRLFKYSIYGLLCYNAVLFFRDDHLAAAQVFAGAVTWRNAVEAYAETVDTMSWVLLLLLFELETAVISDESLQGYRKWIPAGVRLICYFFIVYAFYGYWAKYQMVSNYAPFPIADLCGLIGSNFTYVVTLDEYLPIDKGACVALQGMPLVQIADTLIIGTAAALKEAINFAVVDVVNAAAWLLVVILLEVEVFLQLRHQLTDVALVTMKALKSLLYLVLLGAAVYWGVTGSFLNFWDAFLWLVAFVFIEMNIFEWHEETQESMALKAATA